MHLQRQVSCCIYYFDKERECISESLVVFLAHEFRAILVNHLGEGEPFVRTVCNNALVAFHTGNFPALSNLLLIGDNPFKRSDFFAAPHYAFENRLEFQRWNICAHELL